MVEIQIDIATMENSMEALQRVKNRITIWASNPTSECIYAKEMKSLSRRDSWPCAHAALFAIAKTWKQARCLSKVNG